MITKQFYSHILNMNSCSLPARNFRRVQGSVFRHREIKNGFTGPRSFRGFRETSPRPLKSVMFISEKLVIRYSFIILHITSL